MHWEQRTELADVDPEDLLAALTARPTVWLQPFLRLAATKADPASPPPGGHPHHWYRLGPAVSDHASRFIWHPHGHPRLFTAFRGELGAQALGAGSVLVASGETTGGEEAVNRRALVGLVALLASALRVRSTGSG